MTLTLRVFNFLAFRRKAETESGIETGNAAADIAENEPAYSGAWREERRPGEDFGPVAADAWLFASNQRTFR